MLFHPPPAGPWLTWLLLLWALPAPLPGETSPVMEGGRTEIQYLSGIDKDHPREWEFFLDEGRWSGFTTVIPVPAHWELMGFGRYDYGFYDGKRPEEGRYRHRFTVPEGWQGKRVDLVFEGVMTDAEVRLNGTPAGPVHQGGFTRFRFPVAELLEYPGPNLLEVTVREASANASVNRAERDADYWLFGGIYRPVYLEARPPAAVRRVVVDGAADGVLAVQVHLEGAETGARVVGKLRTAAGEWVGDLPAVTVGTGAVALAGHFPGIVPWSAETPALYQLEVALEDPAGAVQHRVTETVGFRTVELRPKDGLYLNGAKIRLKGINRHAFWPDSGRATTRALSELDVALMREMNLNAVRTSHYPPDPHFLETCDREGLYVLLELPGWHDAYDTAVGSKLVEEMIARDVNHPSVILWSNGNEGGWNAELDPLFDALDPQRRPLLHPDSDDPFRGLATLHYRNYRELRSILFHEGFSGWWAGLWGEPDLYLTTEFLHGLYDGGHGAGLRDFWDALTEAPHGVGGFLWAFLDEGVVRTDRPPAAPDRLDTYTNYAPDGVVGPYREKEGSFYTLRRIFSPVLLEVPERLPGGFEGALPVRNAYHFTDLGELRFRWRLMRLPGPNKWVAPSEAPSEIEESKEPVVGEGVTGAIPPGSAGALPLTLPEVEGADAVEIVALDARGRAVNEWVIPVGERAFPADGAARGECQREGEGLRLRDPAAAVALRIDGTSGELREISREGRTFPFRDGPRFGDGPAAAALVQCEADGSITVTAAGPLVSARWQLLEGGAVELTYRYRPDGLGAVHGPGFSLDRDTVQRVGWRGRGPYRVWANRREGPLYGVWEVAANATATGAGWTLPEFTGFFAAPEWVEWTLEDGALHIEVAEGPSFFQNFHPPVPVDPRFTVASVHPSPVAFLHGISGIGTKFHPAEDLGPQGKPVAGSGEVAGRLVLRLQGEPED